MLIVIEVSVAAKFGQVLAQTDISEKQVNYMMRHLNELWKFMIKADAFNPSWYRQVGKNGLVIFEPLTD